MHKCLALQASHDDAKKCGCTCLTCSAARCGRTIPGPLARKAANRYAQSMGRQLPYPDTGTSQ